VSFDWAEYLSLAESLGGVTISGPPISAEAQQRSCVSRAYYAAFLLARNHLRDVDRLSVPQSGAAHGFVVMTFQNHADPRRARIGTRLRRLRDYRNRCDYDDVVVNLVNLAALSVVQARQIIADLARL
jgi:hypothetical protein